MFHIEFESFAHFARTAERARFDFLFLAEGLRLREHRGDGHIALLVEAGLVKGRQVTSYPSIRTDVENAGGLWQDKEVVADLGLVTSRKPEDLKAFVSKIVEEIEEGRHDRQAA
mgnify:CR=1 FL=1